MAYQVGVIVIWSKCEDLLIKKESKRQHLLSGQGILSFFFSIKHTIMISNIIKQYIFCDSLLSSCSSFRDSAYQEQDQQNVEVSTMTLDDGTDLNGIDKIFEGIPLYQIKCNDECTNAAFI